MFQNVQFKNVTQEMGLPIVVISISQKVESCVKTGIRKHHILMNGLQKIIQILDWWLTIADLVDGLKD